MSRPGSSRWRRATSFPGITTARARIIILCCAARSRSRPVVPTAGTCLPQAKGTKFCRARPIASRTNRPPIASFCLSREWANTIGTGPMRLKLHDPDDRTGVGDAIGEWQLIRRGTALLSESILAERWSERGGAIDVDIMTREQIKAVLDGVRSWPEEDQEELAEIAREIEARRKGMYVLSDEERTAIEEAERSGMASEEEVAAFWKRRGVT